MIVKPNVYPLHSQNLATACCTGLNSGQTLYRLVRNRLGPLHVMWSKNPSSDVTCEPVNWGPDAASREDMIQVRGPHQAIKRLPTGLIGPV